MLSRSKTLICMSHVLQKQVPGLMLSCRQFNKESEGSLYSQDGWDSGYPIPTTPRKDLKRMEPKDKTKVYDACWQSTRRTEYKCRSDPEFNVPAFIDARKHCLADPCANDVLAIDITHYKPSDMGKRKYPRTWYECVVKRRKLKQHCVPTPPPIPRRKRKDLAAHCPVNMCVLGKLDLNLTEPCKLMKPSKCPRFKMPNCCVAARDPPKCRRPFRRCGTRPKTKYPSFSECKKDPFPDARPIECNCLLRPAICEMWRYYRRRNG
ncbi:uncharacterized protein LOC108046478 [Drosophila rhopaloa]|uniref:Uncharacterized protein LOC108046478 n=1 Tax=Drosophila rhopaloa TaxID=1041015 RepID=A0A6P4EU11_DRORH|nr:uncharacterized protein LOC108046478 [Drosophila rhopaloa]